MSKEAEIKALTKQLGQQPPAGVKALPEDELRELEAAIAEARHRQAAALEEAGDRALDRIPRLLRGPVRKVVGV